MNDDPVLVNIHHVQIIIPVGAEQQAREFYCGLLGLLEVPKPDELAGRGGIWLEVGALQVHIGTEEGVARINSRAHVAYEVTGLDAWRHKLETTGSEILDGVPIPHYRRFEFRDPFGNRVEFLERI